jgi:xylan 1,4-beta-xylosidase
MAAKPLRHFWSAVAEGGAVGQALRATWQDQWHVAVAECGFKSVELEGLFDPALRTYRSEGGQDRLDFSPLDDLFDRLVAENTHPFLRLDLPPAVVAAGHVGPFLTRFVQHYEDRYGSPELRQWSFEVERVVPNALHPPADYSVLYASAAAAIKAIDPQLRVGGPLELLVGLTGLPVDFVTARCSPPAGAAVDAMATEVRRLRAAVAASGFPRAELDLAGWDSNAPAQDFIHDSLPAAAWILRNTLEVGDGVDALRYGTFSDQAEGAGAGPGIFHGGPGLMNAQGVVKPAFHAYRYLNALGDELLTAVPGGIVSRRKSSGRVVLLAYNVPPQPTAAWPAAATLAAADRLAGQGSSRTVSINLSGLRPGGQILIEILELNHGNASEAWERMGAPSEPTRPALAVLQSGAREMRLEYRQADELGRFAFSYPLPPWAVLLLREL